MMAIIWTVCCQEILFNVHHKNVIPITCYVDNFSLFENVHLTKDVAENRLRTDLMALKELLKEGQIILIWLESCRLHGFRQCQLVLVPR